MQKTKPKIASSTAALKSRFDKVKLDVANLKKIITGQRDRIDRIFAEETSWVFEELREYYIDHPLVGVIARKLIWQLGGDGDLQTAALFHNDEWQDVTGAPVDITKVSRIRLWHPVECSVDQVMAWRARLAELEIVQPCKQAYREVYLVTGAERTAEVYSNRMAVHMLKQHQMANLMATRGWTYQLMGAFDDGIEGQFARKHFATSHIRAEFLIHKNWDDENINDMGMLIYVGTDQLRFIGEYEQSLRLDDIPIRMFSETMRDADLFVGVASVGNDPAWFDQGPTPEARTYWQNYAFGDLDEFARTRRDVLETVLPRLKIRDQVHIEGKYLIVDGSLNTYKIHLGSSNILMAPGDRYLCIVPQSVSRAKDIALPFEGDARLSVILSKALMLAEDVHITDTDIRRQIGG